MLGRFISADSVVPGAGALTAAPHDATARAAWAAGGGGPANPQELNRYAYGLNNPVRNTDPTGHCPCLAPVVPWAIVAAKAALDAVLVAVGGYLIYDSLQQMATTPAAPAAADSAAAPLPSGDVWAGPLATPEQVPAAPEAGADTSKTYPDLTDEQAKRHILAGDKTGGGHRYGTGKPGKSEFPESWSDEKILGEISDVATDPAADRRVDPTDGRIIVEGTRDGVRIRVVIENPRVGERSVTAYPTNMPRNPR